MEDYTENQKYFNDRFKQELEGFFYISFDITQKGDRSVRDTIQAFFGGIGAGVVVARAADAVGAPGPIGSICGLAAGGIAATYFYMSADESSVMDKAKNAILFLSKSNDSKKCDSEFLDKISFRLVSEFRFSIEMLLKGDTGSNLLIKALINRMMTIITITPHSKLTQLKKHSDKIQFINENIFKEPADEFEKGTKLTVSTDKVDLGWNLEALLFHSPILACSKDNGSRYGFYPYLHTGEKSRQILVGKTDAESSYKYPPRIFDSERKVELTANYKKEDKYTPLSFVSNLDTFEIDDALVCKKGISYIEFFNHLRQAKTQKKTVKALFEAVKCYNKAIKELIEYVQSNGKNTSNYSYLFIEIEMLRNVHRNVLIPLAGSYEKEIKNNKQYSKLFEQFKYDYDELTKLGEKIMGEQKSTGKQNNTNLAKKGERSSFFIKADHNGNYTPRSIKELADKGVEGLLTNENIVVRFIGEIVWGLSFIGWGTEHLVNGKDRTIKCLQMENKRLKVKDTSQAEVVELKTTQEAKDTSQAEAVALKEEIVNLKKEVTDLKDENENTVKKLTAEKTNEKSHLTTENIRLNGDVTRLNGEVTSLKTENTRLNTENTRLNGDVTRLNDEVTSLKAENTRLNGDVMRLNGEVTSLRIKNRDLTDRINGLESQVDIFRQFIREQQEKEKRKKEEKRQQSVSSNIYNMHNENCAGKPNTSPDTTHTQQHAFNF